MEFEALGWPGEDKMQQLICENIIELLEAFAAQGHSGSSAHYALNLFEKLVRFDPISPLTGNDDEWEDVGDGLYQNKRDSEVFKEDGKAAYWIRGKVFREPNGTCFTNSDSHVSVEFPWTKPETEIIEVEEET